jgi:hypothetical protein
MNELNIHEVLQEDSKFVVTTDKEAECVLGKIREEEASAEMWTEHYQSRLDAVKRDKEYNIGRLTAMLVPFFETVPHKAAKASESYTLPSGKLQMKYGTETLQNNDALLDFLKANNMNDYIKVETKETAMWGEFKKTLSIVDGQVVTADGMIIEAGVTVVYKPEVFKVVLSNV